MTTAVHATEIKSYLKCRLSWFWSAPPPRGLGLEPRMPKEALHLGRLIHAALQEYYDEGTPPAVAYARLALLEHERLKEEFGALWPGALDGLAEDAELGVAMMREYEEWAKQDNFKVLATESKWTVPLAWRLRMAGTYDLFIERSDGLWVMDFKTTSYTSTGWTTQDLQASIYVWAARKMYGPEVRGIIFRFLRKKVPETWESLILKSGKVTRKKAVVSTTTYKEYLKALAVSVLSDLPPNHTLAECAEILDANDRLSTLREDLREEFISGYTSLKKEYWDVLQALRDTPSPFFWDVEEYRTNKQLENYFKFVILPAAREMTSRRKKRWIGPTGLGAAFSSCRNCRFRLPCQAAMEGADFQALLREDFQRSKRHANP